MLALPLVVQSASAKALRSNEYALGEQHADTELRSCIQTEVVQYWHILRVISFRLRAFFSRLLAQILRTNSLRGFSRKFFGRMPLREYFAQVQRMSSLPEFFAHLFRQTNLRELFAQVFWKNSLRKLFAQIPWKNSLREFFAQTLWKNPLREIHRANSLEEFSARILCTNSRVFKTVRCEFQSSS